MPFTYLGAFQGIYYLACNLPASLHNDLNAIGRQVIPMDSGGDNHIRLEPCRYCFGHLFGNAIFLMLPVAAKGTNLKRTKPR